MCVCVFITAGPSTNRSTRSHSKALGKFTWQCVFITAVPITKLFAGGEVDIGGHVLVVISGAFINFFASQSQCASESNPKPRPKPKPSTADVAERDVASIGVRSSGNLCVDEEFV